jgi:hypothetical protein
MEGLAVFIHVLIASPSPKRRPTFSIHSSGTHGEGVKVPLCWPAVRYIIRLSHSQKLPGCPP